MSFQFRDVLLRLLEKDPANRVSIQDLKGHPFFEEVDWLAVENRTNEAPFAELLKKGDYIKFRDPTT
jgi:serine/threonine protein kinase